MTKKSTINPRVKPQLEAMLPVKQYLSAREAMAYMDVSANTLADIVKGGHLTACMALQAALDTALKRLTSI